MRRTACACDDDLRSTYVGNYRKESTRVAKKKTVLDFTDGGGTLNHN